jgi:hypothetical protein
MVTAPQAEARCYALILEDAERLDAGDREAGELASRHRTGFAVCVDGIASEYALTPADAGRIVRAARHHSKIVPLAQCWEQP